MKLPSKKSTKLSKQKEKMNNPRKKKSFKSYLKQNPDKIKHTQTRIHQKSLKNENTQIREEREYRMKTSDAVVIGATSEGASENRDSV